jgi:hypothetical protein
VAPLMLVAAFAGALALLDRLLRTRQTEVSQ